MKKRLAFVIVCICLTLSRYNTHAQISPGKLVSAHSKLEGLSNCTACHELGKKVISEKCLDCHKEIKNLISQKKGYHSSTEVTGKDCFSCHSDHHGLKFQIIRFDTIHFNHQMAGYELKGKHAKISCSACHKSEFVKSKTSQKHEGKSYLGLDTKCLSCHTDYHQKTLSADCATCHIPDAFKPATAFKHQNTKYPLVGKHLEVTCLKCHPKEVKEGKDFQKFSGVAFSNCTDCHKDVHENKFGQDCRKCHSENSFHQITTAAVGKFDHSKTDFPLVGKHLSVDCKKCHKGSSYTTPIKFEHCTDCHIDFHKGQFTKNSIVTDCKECHTVNGYLGSSYTIERHNNINFKLDGGHAATPCIACHKKGTEWQFRITDVRCISCHENIHKNHIQDKFIPEGKCESCHNTIEWSKITFDHKTTEFDLKGKHAEKSCRDCHFKKGADELVIQSFRELKTNCESCHTDVHQNQFSLNGVVECTSCHGGFDNWKADRFNHDTTKFKLDGGHKGVDCKKCHLENKSGTIPFIQYKNTDTKCISCHK